MLKIKRKSMLSMLQNREEVNYEKKSNILKWVEDQLESFQYSLCDQNGDFFINTVLREQNKLIVVEIYVKPKRGIFEEIQFRPKMYLSCMDLVRRPKIYNDRRIYHPNINIETLEIIFPEILIDWNPTKKLQILMKSLKYVLIEPNISFVPNTQSNKKAGNQYLFRRNQYRQIMFENMPISYEKKFSNQKEEGNQKQVGANLMSIEEEQSQEKPDQKQQCQWFDIRSIYPSRVYTPKISNDSFLHNYTVSKRSLENIWKDEEEIKILAKQMKKIHFVSDSQSEKGNNQLIQIE